MAFGPTRSPVLPLWCCRSSERHYRSLSIDLLDLASAIDGGFDPLAQLRADVVIGDPFAGSGTTLCEVLTLPGSTDLRDSSNR